MATSRRGKSDICKPPPLLEDLWRESKFIMVGNILHVDIKIFFNYYILYTLMRSMKTVPMFVSKFSGCPTQWKTNCPHTRKKPFP
jgi:hypothetical protein